MQRIPSRREILKALAGLAVPGSLLAGRDRPRGGRGPRRVDQGDREDLGGLRWRDGAVNGAVWRAWPGFYVRIIESGRRSRWEIFADARCTELLADETFIAPRLPRLIVEHHGVRLDVGESADGWYETQVTRRRGLQEELLGARIR